MAFGIRSNVAFHDNVQRGNSYRTFISSISPDLGPDRSNVAKSFSMAGWHSRSFYDCDRIKLKIVLSEGSSSIQWPARRSAVRNSLTTWLSVIAETSYNQEVNSTAPISMRPSVTDLVLLHIPYDLSHRRG